MQDFSEYLVHIQEQLQQPLPLRVRTLRVMGATCVEAYAVYSVLRSFDRGYVSIILRNDGLADWDGDLMKVRIAFEVLEEVPVTREQAEEARQVFHFETGRRIHRVNAEMHAWARATKGGLFLGLLLQVLGSISLFMSVMESHLQQAVLLTGGIVLSWAMAVTVCLRGWHRP